MLLDRIQRHDALSSIDLEKASLERAKTDRSSDWDPGGPDQVIRPRRYRMDAKYQSEFPNQFVKSKTR